jgi:acyl carrier protein
MTSDPTGRLQAEILDEIRRIVATELDAESASARIIELDDELRDFPELDSVGLIVLAVGLEDRFRVKLHDADATAVSTVGELVETVARRMSAGTVGAGEDAT